MSYGKKIEKKTILDKSNIDIKIENLSITFLINENETAATFQQTYSSEQYSDSVKKEIIFQKKR